MDEIEEMFNKLVQIAPIIGRLGDKKREQVKEALKQFKYGTRESN